jgi:hypothetical protein
MRPLTSSPTATICRLVTGEAIGRPVTIERTPAIADIIAGGISIESPRVRVLALAHVRLPFKPDRLGGSLLISLLLSIVLLCLQPRLHLKMSSAQGVNRQKI